MKVSGYRRRLEPRAIAARNTIDSGLRNLGGDNKAKDD